MFQFNEHHELKTLRQSVNKAPALVERAIGPHAVTLLYLYPVQSATPPTALQALNSNMNTVDITATADADVAATVTHNWALTAAQLAQGFPLITLTNVLTLALAALPAWTITTPRATGVLTSTILLTKLATAGSGNAAAQLNVTSLRPHSIMI